MLGGYFPRENTGVSEVDRLKRILVFLLQLLDLRGQVPLTRHFYSFVIPVPSSTLSQLRHPEKVKLRAMIFEMREQGMSYRQIGAALDIHWTRVGQILKRPIILDRSSRQAFE